MGHDASYGVMRQLVLRRLVHQLAAEVTMMEAVLEHLLYHSALSNHSHWDSAGTRGYNCPVCIKQREASRLIRKVIYDQL